MKTSFSSPSPPRSAAAGRRLAEQAMTRVQDYVEYDESRPYCLSPWAMFVAHNLKGHNGIYQTTLTFEYPVDDIADAKPHVDIIIRPEQRDIVIFKEPRYPYHYRKADKTTYDVKDRELVPEIHDLTAVHRQALIKTMIDDGEMYKYTSLKLPNGWKALEKFRKDENPTVPTSLGTIRVNGVATKVENVNCVVAFRVVIENTQMSIDDLTTRTEGWDLKGDA
jgi:hypothetical protein